jgi:hypothetical protein
MKPGEMAKYVSGTQTGRWKGGQENPCVEVSNSLEPGLSAPDLPEYVKPISEALSDKQIKAVEEDRNNASE